MLNDLLSYNDIFVKRTVNVGVLPKEVALNYAVSGPQLRGSGVKWDLRRDDPYSVYHKFNWEPQIGRGEIGTVGDSWNRHIVRMREMEQSLNIVEQALAVLPEGNVQAAVPKRIRPEKDLEIYVRTESSRGELGFYISSDGTTSPFRVKARGPSFSNLCVLPEIVRGSMIADLVLIAGSIDIVLSEVDR
jgi:NADH-quinone oxidoreductase subunit D